MSYSREISTGNWEFTVKRAGVLEKPLYLTFKSESEGIAYCGRLEKLLDKGIVPPQHLPQSRIKTVSDLIIAYEHEAHPSQKDKGVLTTILNGWGGEPLSVLDVDWVDAWITSLKRESKLAPDTIRAKVGTMARCTDWGVRKKLLLLPDHPFRTLPDGYANYTKADIAVAGVLRVDISRERRLEVGEHEKIMETLDLGELPRKQRPLVLEHVPALRCMFILAQESAMRLREMFTLTIDQVDLAQTTIFLDKTKNGSKRQVPTTTVAVAALKTYLEIRDKDAELVKIGRLFPWWTREMSKHELDRVSDYLSKLYASIFEVAGCDDLFFHDLRHEAVSRIFERTDMGDTEIMKITGHKSLKMLARYANLRGSKLAKRMW